MKLIINYQLSIIQMKLFRISLFLFCAMLLSSCIAEWGDRQCQGQFTLFFEYKGGHGDPVALFNENIDVVDLFIFDASGNQVMYRTLPAHALRSGVNSRGTRSTPRPGIELTEAAGFTPGEEYRVVVWGNAQRARQPFEQDEHVNTARIPTASDGGTPLHFGPGRLIEHNPYPTGFWFTFPDTVEDEYDIIRFSRAHVEIKVYVVGTGGAVPGVGVTNVRDGINFSKENSTGRIQFNSQATATENVTIDGITHTAQVTSFYTPLFDENTDKSVLVSLGGNLLDNGNIILRDHIARYDIEFENTNNPEMVVPVLVEVDPDLNIVVSVSILGWTLRDPDVGVGRP